MSEQKFYIEAKAQKSQKPIAQVIKKLGLVFPNSSLGFIHARYASFSEANGNSVLLAETVKEDVPKLLFTQANYQHKREYGPVLGSILDAWVNEDTNEIEIVFSFYKTLYPKLWEQAQKDLDNNNLTVSFELMVSKSKIETLPNGVKKLHRVDFDGVGVLFSGTKPAFKDAFCLESAMLEIEQMLNEDSPELVYANAKNIAEKWTKIGQMLEKAINDKLDINKEEVIMDKKSNDALLATQKINIIDEFGEEAIQGWSDEDFVNEEKINTLRASVPVEVTNRIKELIKDGAKPIDAVKQAWDEYKKKNASQASKFAEEDKDDVLKSLEEVVAEMQITPNDMKSIMKLMKEKNMNKISINEMKKMMKEINASVDNTNAQQTNNKTVETRVYDVTTNDENKTMEVVETITTIVTQDGKEVKTEKVVRITVYTQAQIDAMKADYETKIAEKDATISAKDADIKAKDEAVVAKDVQVKLIKENAKLIITKRNELGDFAKDLSDEDLIANNDKVKIATLTKENVELKAKKTEPIVTANDKTKKEEKMLLEASANGNNVEASSEATRKVMKIKAGQKV